MSTTNKGRKSIFDDALKQRGTEPASKPSKATSRPSARVPVRAVLVSREALVNRLKLTQQQPPKTKAAPVKQKRAPKIASNDPCSRHKRVQCAVCSKKPNAARPAETPLANHGRRRQHKIRPPDAELVLSRRMRSVGTRTNCFNAFPFPGDIDVDFAVDHREYLLACEDARLTRDQWSRTLHQ